MTQPHRFTIQAVLWKYEGKGAWYFVTIPVETSSDIVRTYGSKRRGWGSIPVTVSIGISTWQTSIFPDSKSGTFLLPIKKSIREREVLREGDEYVFELVLRGVAFVS